MSDRFRDPFPDPFALDQREVRDEGQEQEQEDPWRGLPVGERLARAPGGMLASRPGADQGFGTTGGSVFSQTGGSAWQDDGQPQATEDEARGVRARAADAAMGGIRFIASALEPLQLPQDVFFATIEAGLDDDKTILENLREVEWAKYAPGGAAPARVADGEGILELIGVEDPRARKWGGLMMDLVVDPLIFGAALTSVGKLGKMDDLVRLGERMDSLVAPATWGRTAYNRIPAVNSAVKAVTEETLRVMRNPDARLLGALSSDSLNKIARWTLPERTYLRARFQDEELARLISAAPQIGEQRAVDLFTEVEDLTRTLRIEMGDELARETSRNVFRKLGQFRRAENSEAMRRVPTVMRDAMARKGYDFLRQNPGSITPGVGYSDEVADLFNVMPDGTRMPDELAFDPVEMMGRSRVTERNLIQQNRARDEWRRVYDNNIRQGRSDRVARSRAQKARMAVEDQFPQMRATDSLEAFESAVQDIRKLAKEAGYGSRAGEFEATFRNFVTEIAAKKAEIGYELSGVRILQKVVMERGLEVFGSSEDAARLWSRVMHAGVSDEGLEAWLRSSSGIKRGDRRVLTERGVRQAEARLQKYRESSEAIRRRNPNLSDSEVRRRAFAAADSLPEPEVDEFLTGLSRGLDESGIVPGDRLRGGSSRTRPGMEPAPNVGKNEYTWADVIGDEWRGFSALGAGKYLAGLRDGHLYRTYGIWQTPDQIRDWATRVEEGLIIPNNVFDDAAVLGSLTDLGMRAESRAIRDYLDASVRATRRSGETPRGRIVNSRRLADHVAETLERQGVPKVEAGRRAAQAVDAIRESAQGQLNRQANKIRETFVPSLESGTRRVNTAMPGSRFQSRNEFDEEALSLLGEMAEPLTSLADDAAAMTGQLPMMDFLEQVYKQGRNSRMIRDYEYVDEFGTVFEKVSDSTGLPEAFIDRWIHPHLREEIQRAMQRQDYSEGRLGYLRSLITGGYLASPNILTANLAGGILSAWERGIPPHRMLRAMARTFKPLHDQGGLHYQPLRELRAREAISVQAMSAQDIGRTTREFTLTQAALEPRGLRKAFQEITSWYEYILQGGPQATRWAGLSGFQFTEKWMKLSAYEAAQEMGEVFLNGRRHTVDKNLAAELARTAVFDYSELPQALRWGRDYGALLFPGFPYFMTIRTARATLERPGVVALADRAAEAFHQAFANNDAEQVSMWLNMPDYLREDQGVPIARFQDPNDHTRMSFIPMNQLLPTNTFGGNPFAESLATGGLYRPLMEAVYAHLEGSGDAPFSARYGQRVFSPEQGIAGRISATMSFLYNNLAPSSLRKIYSPNSGEGATINPFQNASGLLPGIIAPAEFVNDLYQFDEVSRGRAMRDVRDEIISATIRSTRPIAQEGPLIGIRKEFDAARREHGTKMASLRTRIQRARAQGRTRLVDQLTEDLRRLETEFAQTWGTWMQMSRGFEGN